MVILAQLCKKALSTIVLSLSMSSNKEKSKLIVHQLPTTGRKGNRVRTSTHNHSITDHLRREPEWIIYGVLALIIRDLLILLTRSKKMNDTNADQSLH